MVDDVLRLLCALAAFSLPLLFAGFIAHRAVRRHRDRLRHRRQQRRGRGTPADPS